MRWVAVAGASALCLHGVWALEPLATVAAATVASAAALSIVSSWPTPHSTADAPPAPPSLAVDGRPCVIFSPVFSRHKPVAGSLPLPFHPEQPLRVLRCEEALRAAYDDLVLRWVDPTETHDVTRTTRLLELVHAPAYVARVRALCTSGGGLLDWQTFAGEKTFDVAVLAASAWTQGVDLVLSGGGPVFVLARPPGHHATPTKAEGYCIFCSAAVAARHAVESGAQRVAILDFDVHHGNGIQDCVKGDAQIRFLSLHQEDAFPNSTQQKQSEAGNTRNKCLPRGCTNKPYVAALEEALPFLVDFAPDLLIVAAGYDALAIDPVAQLRLDERAFAEVAAVLQRKFGARIVFGLEGGYDLTGLPKAVVATLEPFCAAVPAAQESSLSTGGGSCAVN